MKFAMKRAHDVDGQRYAQLNKIYLGFQVIKATLVIRTLPISNYKIFNQHRDASNDLVIQHFNVTAHVETKLSAIQSFDQKGFKIAALLLILDSAINIFGIPPRIWDDVMAVRSDYYILSDLYSGEISLLSLEPHDITLPFDLLSIQRDRWITQVVDIL